MSPAACAVRPSQYCAFGASVLSGYFFPKDSKAYAASLTLLALTLLARLTLLDLALLALLPLLIALSLLRGLLRQLRELPAL